MTAIAIDARMARSSGIGTVIVNVARRLVTDNPGWRFVLLGDVAMLKDLGWTGAPNVTCAAFGAPLYSIREQLDFPARLLGGCDLLWSPNYNIPLAWRGRLLVTVHDVAHLVLPEMRRSPAKQVYARAMFAHVRRRADSIAFVSRFSAEDFRARVGTPRGRTLVIGGGVDGTWFDVAQPARPPQPPYILFVGNVKPHKNLSRLLEAFDRIKNTLPHELRIVGRKEGFITSDPAVMRQADGLGARVTFTGQVSDTALREIYAGADALVLPSLYEGFGLPPLEAMAVGCPVLVSRAAALPETCGDAALYCDPLDVGDIAAQLHRLLGDTDLRQSLRAKGRLQARAHNWDAIAQGYRDAFLDLVQ